MASYLPARFIVPPVHERSSLVLIPSRVSFFFSDVNEVPESSWLRVALSSQVYANAVLVKLNLRIQFYGSDLDTPLHVLKEEAPLLLQQLSFNGGKERMKEISLCDATTLPGHPSQTLTATLLSSD